MTAPPSALGPKEPQAPALPQLTDHVTAVLPAATGLANTAAADTVAEAFTASDLGGDEINSTPVGPGAGGSTGEGLFEPPPQPASASKASQPIHSATLVANPAPTRFLWRFAAGTEVLPSQHLSVTQSNTAGLPMLVCYPGEVHRGINTQRNSCFTEEKLTMSAPGGSDYFGTNCPPLLPDSE